MYSLLNFCVFFIIWSTYSWRPSSQVSVEINLRRVIAKINDTFVGVAMNSSFVKCNWKYFNLTSKRIQTLAQGLAPSILRIGGTDANFLIFSEKDDCDMKSVDKNNFQFSSTKFDPVNFTMSGASWDSLHKFLGNVGWQLLFDLNAFLRFRTFWSVLNAYDLVKYTEKKNYTMAGWELGNEPEEYPKFHMNISVTQVARDYLYLYVLLSLTTPEVRGSIMTGPGTIPLLYPAPIQYFNKFLEAGGGEYVTFPSFHHYYVDGKYATLADFINPKLLDQLQQEISTANTASNKHAWGKQVWIGETSSAWNSGAKNLSDVFVAGFMWLDKLGIAARNNIRAVIRQTFFGGDYGLVDHNTMDPNPDYWLTLLFKRLVGGPVFQTETDDKERRVRFYAHCSRAPMYPHGSLTVYGMNIYNKSTEITFNGTIFDKMDMDVYLMTAMNNNIRSKFVRLNGKVLRMTSDDRLPDIMKPVVMQGRFTMPPFSYVFAVIPKAGVEACKSNR